MRNRQRHKQYGRHTYKRDAPQRMHGRMHRKDKNTDADKHNQRRKENRLAKLRQNRFAGTTLIEQTFHNKNGIVVSLPKDKCSENNIDNIELHP